MHISGKRIGSSLGGFAHRFEQEQKMRNLVYATLLTLTLIFLAPATVDAQ
jgi:hypothetical protein